MAGPVSASLFLFFTDVRRMRVFVAAARGLSPGRYDLLSPSSSYPLNARMIAGRGPARPAIESGSVGPYGRLSATNPAL